MTLSPRVPPAASLLALLACSGPSTPRSTEFVALPTGDTVALHAMGSAPDTVVILSGGPAFGSRYLESALVQLAERHTLLFLDLRGRGEAPAASAESLSMAGDLRDLEAVRAHLELERFALVGHDWGAGLALLYALGHPAAVSRLALIGPMPDGITTVFEMTRLPHDSAALARHAAVVGDSLMVREPAQYCRDFWGFALSPGEVVNPGVVRRLNHLICGATPNRLLERQSIGRALYGSLGSWEWRDTMPGLRAPTLVVVGGGADSRVVTARRWATEVADGRLLVLGKTPAFPWVEAPIPFTTALQEFLAGDWPAQAEPGSTAAASQHSQRGS